MVWLYTGIYFSFMRRYAYTNGLSAFLALVGAIPVSNLFYNRKCLGVHFCSRVFGYFVLGCFFVMNLKMDGHEEHTYGATLY